MIYFKRTPSGLRTDTAICAPASSPRISGRCSCVRGAYARPSRSAEGLGDFFDLLAEADPAGAAGAAAGATTTAAPAAAGGDGAGKTLYLSADTAEDKAGWVAALRAAVAALGLRSTGQTQRR